MAARLLLLGNIHEEPAEQWCQVEEILGRARDMEAGVSDTVVAFQPLEEALLHVRRAESQPLADIVKAQ